jgi:hypothetical protein
VRKKLLKTHCEVCGWNDDISVLEGHHIVEQTDMKTSNHPMNIAILCPTCHALQHSGRLKIIGVYPSTNPPHGRLVVYEKDGKSNFPGITEPYFKHKPKQMKVTK